MKTASTIGRLLCSFICAFLLCCGLIVSPTYASTLPSPTDTATAGNVLTLAKATNSDIYKILSTVGSDSYLQWFDSDLISDYDTATHESFHSFSFDQSTSYDQASGYWTETIFLGGNVSYSLKRYNDLFETSLATSSLPESLQTFRYSTYVASGSTTSANIEGAWGLMNEFCAYYWGLNSMYSLQDYLKDQNSAEAWDQYANHVGNDANAYAEFKYWYLTYMIYAKEHYPALYRELMGDADYCNAYAVTETKFASLVSQVLGGADSLDVGLICSTEGIYGPGGYGVSLANYYTLTEALADSEYVAMDKEIKSKATNTSAVCITHTPASAVRENTTAATCTDEGSYDEVTYCKKCGAEISREKKAITALGHSWGKWSDNGDGTATRTCSRCDTSQSKSVNTNTNTNSNTNSGSNSGKNSNTNSNTNSGSNSNSGKNSNTNSNTNSGSNSNSGKNSNTNSNTNSGSSSSSTATGVEAFAERLYTEVLGRTPDADGLATQVAALRSGTAPAEIAYNYFAGPEYQGKGESASQTVERVYRVMFGRAADDSGKAMWVGYLEDGMSVRAVIAGFSQSTEYKEYFSKLGVDNQTIGVTEPRDQNHGVTAFCGRLYTKCLGRSFDASGINVQAGAILGGMSASQIAVNFFTGAEFAAQKLSNADTVERCYETMMGRASDADGKAFWLAQMKSGMSVEGLVQGFAQSQEWTDICANYGVTK